MAIQHVLLNVPSPSEHIDVDGTKVEGNKSMSIRTTQ